MDYNWTGWEIETKSFGKHFDLNARKRMVEGSKKLEKLILKYESSFGNNIIEFGPFFNPLCIPENHPQRKVFYIDNDVYVIHSLQEKYGKIACLIDINFKNVAPDFERKFDTLFLKKINSSDRVVFDVVILSHVLNYIDYVAFLNFVSKRMSKGAYLFINNVCNYGIPDYFSNQRPKSITNILKVIKNMGMHIVEKEIVETPYRKYQPNKRLLLMAKK